MSATFPAGAPSVTAEKIGILLGGRDESATLLSASAIQAGVLYDIEQQLEAMNATLSSKTRDDQTVKTVADSFQQLHVLLKDVFQPVLIQLGEHLKSAQKAHEESAHKVHEDLVELTQQIKKLQDEVPDRDQNIQNVKTQAEKARSGTKSRQRRKE
jgi:prefoldin subunit 5